MAEVNNAHFVIIPSNMIQSIIDPSLVNVLLDVTSDHIVPKVLIIEDADECLTTRGADNISAISALLNLSDGILGHLLNLRIVVTTNRSVKDIDKAVMRPGRLCKRIEIGHLNNEQALKVYKRLTGKDDNPFGSKSNWTLAETYSAAKEGGTTTDQPKKFGF